MKIKTKITLKNITFCCKDCGNRISRSSAFYGDGNCLSCARIGKNNPNFGVHLTGKNSPLFGRKYSKEHRLKISLSKKGKNNPFYGKKRPNHSIAISGKNNGMFGIKLIGKNNPNYIHGNSYAQYPLEFKNIKQSIRKRDNYTCQYCRLKENNKFRKLDIHHIDYNKQNCKEDNLITLCRKCNIKANYDRDYWFAYYTHIIKHFITKN